MEDRTRLENVHEVLSSIQNYLENAVDEPSLAGFLDEIALYTDLDSHDPSEDCVVMMTMHSAKGLEFPVVFVVGVEEGIFPGIRAIGEAEEMEEERRLCYVAMTRAKEKLYMTCASQRMLFGRTNSNRPSRFLGEIPPEYVEKSGRLPYAERAERETERPARRTPLRRTFDRGFSMGARPRLEEPRGGTGLRRRGPARLQDGGQRPAQGLRPGPHHQGYPHGGRRPGGDRLRQRGYQEADAQVRLTVHEEALSRGPYSSSVKLVIYRSQNPRISAS